MEPRAPKRADVRAALSELCAAYWYPVYAFTRRQGRSAEDASEMTQELFSQLIARNDFATADPARGRFRSWLLACARNCLSNERDRATALKRGGGIETVSIDAQDAERRYMFEPSHEVTPERLFERRWAMTLLTRAHAALSEECGKKGKGVFFERVKGLFVFGQGGEDPDYEAIGGDIDMTPGAAKTAVSRLRDRYAALLRAEIAQTLERTEDVEEEWRHLREVLESDE